MSGQPADGGGAEGGSEWQEGTTRSRRGAVIGRHRRSSPIIGQRGGATAGDPPPDQASVDAVAGSGEQKPPVPLPCQAAKKHWIEIHLLWKDTGEHVTAANNVPPLGAQAGLLKDAAQSLAPPWNDGQGHQKDLDAGKYEVSFPAIKDPEWMIVGAGVGPADKAGTYTVLAGDCFSSIAAKLGFFDYMTLYAVGENQKTWPNPNLLTPGQAIDVPDLASTKKIEAALDHVHRFEVVRRKTKLRLTVVDPEGKPVDAAAHGLTVGGAAAKTTLASNVIEAVIDPRAGAGVLTLPLTAPSARTPPKPPPKPASTDVVEPPRVTDDDFADPPAAPERVEKVVWTLALGAMQPKGRVAGALARLRNFGFVVVPGDVETDETKLVVKAYQRRNKTTEKGKETGAAADIGDHISTRHDRPAGYKIGP